MFRCISQLWRKPRRQERPSLTADDYRRIAIELGSVRAILDAWLQRARAAAYKDMKKVSPGVWIHKDFQSLGDAIGVCNAMLLDESKEQS